MTQWKYTDTSRNAVWRELEDGSQESCLADREDVQQYLADGGVIAEPDLPPEPPKPTLSDLEAQIQALMAQVQAFK
jgi:hypothetical protein